MGGGGKKKKKACTRKQASFPKPQTQVGQPQGRPRIQLVTSSDALFQTVAELTSGCKWVSNKLECSL